MDGILNIDKPRGRTSFSIVAEVRRLSGERRVGHGGTLDPEATGVLAVCIGQATRVVEFLFDTFKTYRAEVEFGVTTDSHDATGTVLRREDASGVSREQVEEALGSFRGWITQTPPMYSAVKYHGRPLYELARAGITVERKARLVEVRRLELTAWDAPVAAIEVDCGKGTYIRALAHDLGEALGCGASLRSLVRTRCGSFAIEDAVSVSRLEEAFDLGDWHRFVHPMDSVLSAWKAVVVNEETAQAIRYGQPVELGNGWAGDERESAETSPGERCRAYTAGGFLLGLLRFDDAAGHWRPEKVFRQPG